MDEKKLPKKIAIHPDVMVQEVDDEMVLLHSGTEEYFSLDDVGSTMWKYLSELDTIDEVVVALIDAYDVDEQRLRRDLSILLTKLVEQDLVTVLQA